MEVHGTLTKKEKLKKKKKSKQQQQQQQQQQQNAQGLMFSQTLGKSETNIGLSGSYITYTYHISTMIVQNQLYISDIPGRYCTKIRYKILKFSRPILAYIIFNTMKKMQKNRSSVITLPIHHRDPPVSPHHDDFSVTFCIFSNGSYWD